MPGDNEVRRTVALEDPGGRFGVKEIAHRIDSGLPGERAYVHGRVDAQHLARSRLEVLQQQSGVASGLENERIGAEVAPPRQLRMQLLVMLAEHRGIRCHVEVVTIELGGVEAVTQLQVAAGLTQL